MNLSLSLLCTGAFMLYSCCTPVFSCFTPQEDRHRARILSVVCTCVRACACACVRACVLDCCLIQHEARCDVWRLKSFHSSSYNIVCVCVRVRVRVCVHACVHTGLVEERGGLPSAWWLQLFGYHQRHGQGPRHPNLLEGQRGIEIKIYKPKYINQKV